MAYYRNERVGPSGPLRRVAVAVVVPRLLLGLGLSGPRSGETGPTWGDTAVTLPPGRWTDTLGGAVVDGGQVALEPLLARFPMALLVAA